MLLLARCAGGAPLLLSLPWLPHPLVWQTWGELALPREGICLCVCPYVGLVFSLYTWAFTL